MAKKGPKFQFKIPSPGGMNAKSPTKFQAGKAQTMLNQQPTDAAQDAPTNAAPVPQHYRHAGGY